MSTVAHWVSRAKFGAELLIFVSIRQGLRLSKNSSLLLRALDAARSKTPVLGPLIKPDLVSLEPLFCAANRTREPSFTTGSRPTRAFYSPGRNQSRSSYSRDGHRLESIWWFRVSTCVCSQYDPCSPMRGLRGSEPCPASFRLLRKKPEPGEGLSIVASRTLDRPIASPECVSS